MSDINEHFHQVEVKSFFILEHIKQDPVRFTLLIMFGHYEVINRFFYNNNSFTSNNYNLINKDNKRASNHNCHNKDNKSNLQKYPTILHNLYVQCKNRDPSSCYYNYCYSGMFSDTLQTCVSMV
ncbi:hypothetical protein HELRODRAFT_172612 [Helobdella robusta]|uniref:Uncharacterized protein n=1 Tax=Helobdella robusta TaxID=6412 RepID=T1F5M5_HELRO|nr:hypothetical protein HELRODRAFT_172612 [Helobdella robusta]ESO04256.1 hypothetical protein HELRODRAFT_172612 [Helobdella robusta]